MERDERRELLSLPGFRSKGGLILRKMPEDEVPFAYFEDEIPSESQRKKILRRGYGLSLNVIPAEHLDLKFLADFSGLTRLSIISLDATAQRVVDLPELIELHLLTEENGPVDLFRLPRLRVFSGSLEGNESVFGAPAIQEIFLEETDGRAIPTIPDQLENLTVTGARGVRELVPRGAAPFLRTLAIYDTPSFDLASLVQFPRLRFVYLDGVRKVVISSSLADFSAKTLSFINCGSVRDPERLAEIEGAEIFVMGKKDKALRSIAAVSPSRWEFSGRP